MRVEGNTFNSSTIYHLNATTPLYAFGQTGTKPIAYASIARNANPGFTTYSITPSVTTLNYQEDTSLVQSAHFVGLGSAPTAAASTAGQLGTGPTASMVSGSTDSSGSFTVTTGTSPGSITAGFFQLATITFAKPYANTAAGVVIAPANTTAAQLATGTNGLVCFANQGNVTATSFVVFCSTNGTVTLAASTAYRFSYAFIGK
jgi:hypothetical protein